jgi:hypothetical protein
MSPFTRQFNKRNREISQIFNKHRKIFAFSTPPNIIAQPSKKGMNNGVFEIRNTNLKEDLGHIQGYIDYEYIEDDLVSVEYSFKFFSKVDTLQFSVNGSAKTPKTYGFRFEKSTLEKGWGHPLMHLQFEYSTKPRFAQYYSNEVDALEDFMATIHQTYCKESSDYELQHRSVAEIQ